MPFYESFDILPKKLVAKNETVVIVEGSVVVVFPLLLKKFASRHVSRLRYQGLDLFAFPSNFSFDGLTLSWLPHAYSNATLPTENIGITIGRNKLS